MSRRPVLLLLAACGGSPPPAPDPVVNQPTDAPITSARCPAPHHDVDPARVEVGDRFPPLDGIDAAGRAMVVSIGADWCLPCLEVLEVLDRLAAARDPARVVFVGLFVEDEPTRRFAHLRTRTIADRDDDPLLHDQTVPITLVVDRCGIVTYRTITSFGEPVPPEIAAAGG
jgi:thiol-disulfide isomerase/thioredoxin